MNRCPEPLALSEAIRQGEQSPWHQHISTCALCSQSARLAGLAKQLPQAIPTEAQRQRVLSSLLAQAQVTPPYKPNSFWWVLPLAASIALAFVFWPKKIVPTTSSAPTSYAKIAASQPAKYQTAYAATGQSVSLQNGTLQIDATQMSPNKMLSIKTQDATIETLYSIFTVAAYEGRLLRVEVIEGQLVLRLLEADNKTLTAGQTWEPTPTTVAVVTPKEPQKIVEATSQPKKTVEAPIQSSPEEEAYQEGVAALKSGDFSIAVERFSLVKNSSKEPSLIEDASFWYTVALLRSNRDKEAKDALQQFVSAFPGAARAGEARVALGWLLLESGNKEEAKKQFAAAKEDRSSAVRSSAQMGLEAIDASPKTP